MGSKPKISTARGNTGSSETSKTGEGTPPEGLTLPPDPQWGVHCPSGTTVCGGHCPSGTTVGELPLPTDPQCGEVPLSSGPTVWGVPSPSGPTVGGSFSLRTHSVAGFPLPPDPQCGGTLLISDDDRGGQRRKSSHSGYPFEVLHYSPTSQYITPHILALGKLRQGDHKFKHFWAI